MWFLSASPSFLGSFICIPQPHLPVPFILIQWFFFLPVCMPYLLYFLYPTPFCPVPLLPTCHCICLGKGPFAFIVVSPPHLVHFTGTTTLFDCNSFEHIYFTFCYLYYPQVLPYMQFSQHALSPCLPVFFPYTLVLLPLPWVLVILYACIVIYALPAYYSCLLLL